MLMRVGLDISPLRFPHTGIAVYTLQLIRALHQQIPSDVALIGFTGLGFRPLTSAFATSAMVRNDQRGRKSSQSLWKSPWISSPLPLLRERSLQRRLLRFIKERVFEAGRGRFDLFHATVTFPPGRIEKPLIPLVHDLSLLRHPETHPPERVQAFERWLPVIQRASVINTVSSFSKGEIVSLLGVPAGRVVVTRPGVDPLFLAEDEMPADGEAAQRFGARRGEYLLAVGSLEPRKNLSVALEAFAALSPASHRKVTLLIVGPPGWGKIRVPQAARRLCESGAIRFTGYVDRHVLRSLYVGAALVVYPSIYEGFGIPPAEALACGTRVAVSRGSSLEEVVGPYGMLLMPDDVDGWRYAMQEALATFGAEDESLRMARRQWAAQFDWNITAAKTLALYSRTCSANN